jgi:hypothetical protein
MNIVRHTQIEADDHLRSICRQIIAENKTMLEWDQIESDDMFSDGPFSGGYDATEQEFLFSYYALDEKEYWLGFSLEIAKKIADGSQYFLDIREAQ